MLSVCFSSLSLIANLVTAAEALRIVAAQQIEFRKWQNGVVSVVRALRKFVGQTDADVATLGAETSLGTRCSSSECGLVFFLVIRLCA